ncbi:hypothetical protein L484_026596 [Morus notabilis]|uniref:Uncharacterized protein n=1 Tax=Morus notabilis TaxID=981085 RepID=W9SCR0_9ROSA|nr:hypothetical protein L484_026596 [Morus notabilis]
MDRFSRFFPCLSDPARRSALGLKVSLVILHVIYVGILFLFDGDLIEKTKREPWYTSIYLLLFVATLVQYFITSSSSPGYVIDAIRAVNESNAICKSLSVASKQPAPSKSGNTVVITDSSQSAFSGNNLTSWTKLVMDMYPPGTSIRTFTCSYCNVEQDNMVIFLFVSICSLHEQDTVMIVIDASFSLIIIVFGLEHVLARTLEAPIRAWEDIRIPNTRRGRGRPRITWTEVVRKDILDLGLQESIISNRAAWSKSYFIIMEGQSNDCLTKASPTRRMNGKSPQGVLRVLITNINIQVIDVDIGMSCHHVPHCQEFDNQVLLTEVASFLRPNTKFELSSFSSLLRALTTKKVRERLKILIPLSLSLQNLRDLLFPYVGVSKFCSPKSSSNNFLFFKALNQTKYDKSFFNLADLEL